MKKLLSVSILLLSGCATTPPDINGRPTSYKKEVTEETLAKDRERYARKAQDNARARENMERLKLSSTPMLELCELHRASTDNGNKFFNEIQRRAGFTTDEIQYIATKRFNYGISEFALLCVLGHPEATESLLPLNIIRYIYKTGFIDFKDDKIVAIKQTK